MPALSPPDGPCLGEQGGAVTKWDISLITLGVVDSEKLPHGIVAQLEERLLHTQEVIGSRPVGPICIQ